ncbi:MAG: energy-coupled thiamine transporter ThiT [Bacillota bacterium]|nr:energy-coupled thiamine transporter ThiT [Bacillota bacterium]
MKKYPVKMLTEGAIVIALATVLSFIKLWKMPQGGSVTAASMVPLLLFAYRWGGAKGLLVSVVYGCMQYLIKPEANSPISFLLDYPIAFGVIGISGFLSHRRKSFTPIALGAAVGLALRYIAHVISGVVFYYMYAPEGMPVLLYALGYNSYMLPELIIAILVLFLLYKPLQRIKA